MGRSPLVLKVPGLTFSFRPLKVGLPQNSVSIMLVFSWLHTFNMRVASGFLLPALGPCSPSFLSCLQREVYIHSDFTCPEQTSGFPPLPLPTCLPQVTPSPGALLNGHLFREAFFVHPTHTLPIPRLCGPPVSPIQAPEHHSYLSCLRLFSQCFRGCPTHAGR